MTKPSAAYTSSARKAVAGLFVFIVFYCALTGWFLYTAWRAFSLGGDSAHPLTAWAIGTLALLLGVFMVKAMFSVRHAQPEGLLEVTRAEQPRLFEFIDSLADAAGAPRAHRVFLSPEVNASVFYELSLMNLFFPSKKNLLIGLGLVNSLSLGELRAVLAHEFGHFAQRSMLIGRWVYVAQQIAGHLVTRRDALDHLLERLANVDVRLRVLVGVVQLILWSIRSLVESLFGLVFRMRHALGREMELQADLVAVSLTGSDALVHALHRIDSAEDGWNRALEFVFEEKQRGHITRDVFAVQSHFVQRMAVILNDDSYGQVPPVPEKEAHRHRVFKPELARPPTMWQSHPLNFDREVNAKRIYVRSPEQTASAWSLLSGTTRLRETMTARLLGESTAKAEVLEESLKRLGRRFRHEQYGRRYNGIFFDRPLARHAETVQELRNPRHLATLEELGLLYPPSLTGDIHQLRELEREREQLQALIDGRMEMTLPAVRVLGTAYDRKRLPVALQKLNTELVTVQERLRQHDYLCRSWHQASAAELGGGWQTYLDGLLGVIHYAEHTAADVRDAFSLYSNAVSVETALGKVSAKGAARLVEQANALYAILQEVYQQGREIELDTGLAGRLAPGHSWSSVLGSFSLTACQVGTLSAWHEGVGRSVAHVERMLSILRSAALEQLLLTETTIARQRRLNAAPGAAPAPSRVPASYPRRYPGQLRERQTQLGWWARFQRAEGTAAAAARLFVAGAIVLTVLSYSNLKADRIPLTVALGPDPILTVYNGLGLPVTVTVDGRTADVAMHGLARINLVKFGQHHVKTTDATGREIETFDAQSHGGALHPVYSVAGAVPLVATAPSGKSDTLGAPRWLESDAALLFAKPTAGGGQTRLDAPVLGVGGQLDMIDKLAERQRVIIAHARWDSAALRTTSEWLTAAQMIPSGADIFALRLAEEPDNISLLRIELMLASPARVKEVCDAAGARAAAAPDDANLHYVTLMCKPGNATALREAHARWPEHPWIAYAYAQTLLRTNEWMMALPLLEKARKGPETVSADAALAMARIERNMGRNNLERLLPSSAPLAELVAWEKSGPYASLASGDLDAAMAAAHGPSWQGNHLLRMIAASDGASDDVVKRVLAMPAGRGLDDATCMTSLALAMRRGADSKDLAVEAKLRFGSDEPALAGFLADVRKRRDPHDAEAALVKLPPDLRGYAYSAALVLLGDKAPAEWREGARRLLFASERPYFGAQ